MHLVAATGVSSASPRCAALKWVRANDGRCSRPRRRTHCRVWGESVVALRQPCARGLHTSQPSVRGLNKMARHAADLGDRWHICFVHDASAARVSLMPSLRKPSRLSDLLAFLLGIPARPSGPGRCDTFRETFPILNVDGVGTGSSTGWPLTAAVALAIAMWSGTRGRRTRRNNVLRPRVSVGLALGFQAWSPRVDCHGIFALSSSCFSMYEYLHAYAHSLAAVVIAGAETSTMPALWPDEEPRASMLLPRSSCSYCMFACVGATSGELRDPDSDMVITCLLRSGGFRAFLFHRNRGWFPELPRTWK